MQCLCLLLHHRCIRHLARGLTKAWNGALLAPQLQWEGLRAIEQLIALEGGGPTPPIHIRFRASNFTELPQHREAVACFEAALAACETSKCERPGCVAPGWNAWSLPALACES